MHKYQNLKYQLEELISILESQLSREEAEEVREFVEVYEFGLAYETLCDIILEEERKIPQEVFDTLENLGREMEMDQGTWLKLKPYVQDV